MRILKDPQKRSIRESRLVDLQRSAIIHMSACQTYKQHQIQHEQQRHDREIELPEQLGLLFRCQWFHRVGVLLHEAQRDVGISLGDGLSFCDVMG